jgi:hypothetical protein
MQAKQEVLRSGQHSGQERDEQDRLGPDFEGNEEHESEVGDRGYELEEIGEPTAEAEGNVTDHEGWRMGKGTLNVKSATFRREDQRMKHQRRLDGKCTRPIKQGGMETFKEAETNSKITLILGGELAMDRSE